MLLLKKISSFWFAKYDKYGHEEGKKQKGRHEEEQKSLRHEEEMLRWAQIKREQRLIRSESQALIVCKKKSE